MAAALTVDTLTVDTFDLSKFMLQPSASNAVDVKTKLGDSAATYLLNHSRTITTIDLSTPCYTQTHSISYSEVAKACFLFAWNAFHVKPLGAYRSAKNLSHIYHHNGKTTTGQEVLPESDLLPIVAVLGKLNGLKSISLGNHRWSQTCFSTLIAKIEETQVVTQLKVDPSVLTEPQKKDLYKLAQDGRKGLMLTDLAGRRFGPLYTHYEAYFDSKREIGNYQLKDVTRKALTLYKEKHQGTLPKCVVDFGSGGGPDTVPLNREGCQKIYAVESDEIGMRDLKANLSGVCQIVEHQAVKNIVTIASDADEKESVAKESVVHCCKAHFVEFVGAAPVDFLVSSFTWPYRSPDQFAGMWEKQLKMLMTGAVIVGQFFEKPDAPKDHMTYHTEQEVKQLLETHFEILFFEAQQAKDMKIHGDGSPPEFKAVYHIVAQRKALLPASK